MVACGVAMAFRETARGRRRNVRGRCTRGASARIPSRASSQGLVDLFVNFGDLSCEGGLGVLVTLSKRKSEDFVSACGGRESCSRLASRELLLVVLPTSVQDP